MADGTIEDSLEYITRLILQDPTSSVTRAQVLESSNCAMALANDSLNKSEQEYLALLKISILKVGLLKKEISDPQLLFTLANVVPSNLGADTLYPINESGVPRLWLYSDLNEGRGAKEWQRDDSPFYCLLGFGRYALFVAGIMPNLLRSAKQRSVDISYYEQGGATALNQASRNSQAEQVLYADALEEMASNVSAYRRLLNEASVLVGATARKTTTYNLLDF